MRIELDLVMEAGKTSTRWLLAAKKSSGDRLEAATMRISTIFLIVTSALFYRLLQRSGLHLDLAKTSSKALERGKGCRLYKDPEHVIGPVEDIRAVSKGVFLSQSMRLIEFFNSGEDSLTGSILAYHPDSERVRKVPLEGFSGVFRPHGINFSNSTKRLYVVNHHKDHPRVEVFSVSNPESYESVALKHIKTLVVSDLGFGQVNSVSEGALDGADIYFSEWQCKPLPQGGLDHPATTQEVANVFRGLLYNALVGTLALPGLSKTGGCGVWRCVVATGVCEKLETGLYMPNGLDFTPDRQALYVIDLMEKTISLFARDSKTGRITLKFVQETPHAVDNISIRPTGFDTWEMLMGTIPDMMDYVAEGQAKDNRPLMGGLTIAKKISWALNFTDVVIHDGKLVSSISTGAVYGDKIYIGGPKTPGLLVC